MKSDNSADLAKSEIDNLCESCGRYCCRKWVCHGCLVGGEDAMTHPLFAAIVLTRLMYRLEKIILLEKLCHGFIFKSVSVTLLSSIVAVQS